jgi:hypothetical protein
MSLTPQVASHTIPHCSPLVVAKVGEKFCERASYHLAAEHTCAVIYCGQKLSWLFGKLDFPALSSAKADRGRD